MTFIYKFSIFELKGNNIMIRKEDMKTVEKISPLKSIKIEKIKKDFEKNNIPYSDIIIQNKIEENKKYNQTINDQKRDQKIKTSILTRNFPLRIFIPDTNNKKERNDKYKLLDDLQKEISNCINDTIRECFLNNGCIQSNFYSKYSGVTKFKGFSKIFSCAQREGDAKYRKWKKEFDKHETNMSLPISGSFQPIPIDNQLLVSGENKYRIYSKKNDYYWNFHKDIIFQFCFIDTKRNRGYGSLLKKELEECLIGKREIVGSKLIKKKNKWILCLSQRVKIEKNNILDPDISMGIDLGIKNPIVCQITNTKTGEYKYSKFIVPKDSGNEVLQVLKRKAIKRQRKAASAISGRGGHGRKRKMQWFDNINHHDKQVDYINHTLSRRVIDLAVEHNVSTIFMEDLSGISNQKKKNIFLKYWTYFALQEKIEYKAKLKGIKIRYIKPNDTSQRCSECGNINGENRKGDKFICLNCGYKDHADINAAKNISDILAWKEDCLTKKNNKKIKNGSILP